MPTGSEFRPIIGLQTGHARFQRWAATGVPWAWHWFSTSCSTTGLAVPTKWLLVHGDSDHLLLLRLEKHGASRVGYLKSPVRRVWVST